jgi:peptidoglycan/xylan/chitin deacetylase (PgdA/CDA1 family)
MLSRFMTLGFLAGAMLALSGVALPAHAGQSIAEDAHAAVIFAYHRVGDDENPAASIRQEQFIGHINELIDDEYNVIALDDIISAFEAGTELPPRTVGLSFDGGDASFLTGALPLLEQHKLPYTLFITPGQTEAKTGRTIGWADLRKLEKTGLAHIGLHPNSYGRLANAPEAEIRHQINMALTAYREELGHEPTLFAYPFGEYGKTYRAIIEASGFKAAFGQQSGVAYDGSDRFALPRFAMTERYGDTDRFQMISRALPLPVSGIEPADPILGGANPVIGFTVADALSGSLKNLACYASGQERPAAEIIGNRVELRLREPVTSDRVRINCTLPGPQTAPEDAPIWRWFGLLLSVPENRDAVLIGDEDEDEGVNVTQTGQVTQDGLAP